MKKLLAILTLGTMAFASMHTNGTYKCVDTETGDYYILEKYNKTIRDTKQGDMYMLEGTRKNDAGDQYEYYYNSANNIAIQHFTKGDWSENILLFQGSDLVNMFRVDCNKQK